MLTTAEITAGTARLDDEATLKPVDVDVMASVFRMFLGDLETKYNYQLESKLSELNDVTGDNATKLQASQVAACLTGLEDLGFGAVEKKGGRSGTIYNHLKEIWQLTSFAFVKIYQIPVELSSYDLVRARMQSGRTSLSTCTTRSWC